MKNIVFMKDHEQAGNKKFQSFKKEIYAKE